MVEPITLTVSASAIIAGWKIAATLYEKYKASALSKTKSKKAQALKDQAEALMVVINRKILSGISADDPQLASEIKEFKEILAQGIKPADQEKTDDWIDRSKIIKSKPAAKSARKPAAKPKAKSAATKLDGKPTAKPRAKSVTGKSTGKPAAKLKAKSGAEKSARKPVVKNIKISGIGP